MAKESVVLRDDYTSLSAIVFIFWTQQDNQAYDCTLVLPLYCAYLYPWFCFESAKLRSTVSFLLLYNSFPSFDIRLNLASS